MSYAANHFWLCGWLDTKQERRSSSRWNYSSQFITRVQNAESIQHCVTFNWPPLGGKLSPSSSWYWHWMPCLAGWQALSENRFALLVLLHLSLSICVVYCGLSCLLQNEVAVIHTTYRHLIINCTSKGKVDCSRCSLVFGKEWGPFLVSIYWMTTTQPLTKFELNLKHNNGREKKQFAAFALAIENG